MATEGPWVDGPWSERYDENGNYIMDREVDWGADLKEQRRAYTHIEATAEHGIITFPVADGEASYLVESIEPPVLRLIPFLDAYQIDPAYIRGLRAEDIRDRLESRRRLKELFAKAREDEAHE